MSISTHEWARRESNPLCLRRLGYNQVRPMARRTRVARDGALAVSRRLCSCEGAVDRVTGRSRGGTDRTFVAGFGDRCPYHWTTPPWGCSGEGKRVAASGFPTADPLCWLALRCAAACRPTGSEALPADAGPRLIRRDALRFVRHARRKRRGRAGGQSESLCPRIGVYPEQHHRHHAHVGVGSVNEIYARGMMLAAREGE